MKLLDRALPFTVGPYIFLEKLGQGGMGQVFLVRESLSNGETRFQVVKTLRADRYDDEHRRRFFDEVRVVVQLAHPNICRVRSAGELEDTPFLSMDHIAGVDLKVLFAAMQGEPVPPDVATLVACEMLAALDHAHRAVDEDGQPLNIVHRDVSPNNVL